MATYNCSDSANQAYGAGNYSTCDGQAVGAPNTGDFGAFLTSAAPMIVLPFTIAIILTVIATVILKRKKRT